MNTKLKHIIIGVFSLMLILSTSFVLRKAENAEQLKNLWLGYPFPFIAQDFSAYNQGFAYFPKYGKLELQKQNILPITHFSIVNFVASFVVVFISLEILIFLMENIKYWIQNLFGNNDSSEEN